MDVGTELHGMLKMEEFAEGFPLQGWPPALGQQLQMRILNMDRKGFGLTMRPGSLQRPPRKPKGRKGSVDPFTRVSAGKWLDGEVQGMTKWGVFVDVIPPSGGPPFAGLVHRDTLTEDVAKTLVVGNKVKVRVVDVDRDRGRLSLTLQEP